MNEQQESDVAAPAFLGGTLQTVRLTVRDVLLKRADDSVKCSPRRRPVRRAHPDHDRGTVAAAHPRLQLGGRARRRQGVPRHQHALGVERSDVAFAQASELLAGPPHPRTGR